MLADLVLCRRSGMVTSPPTMQTCMSGAVLRELIVDVMLSREPG